MYDPTEMLEDFITSIDNLPSEIQFIFKEIQQKDLDFNNNAASRKASEVTLKNLDGENDDSVASQELMKSIMEQSVIAKALCEDKVKLAERAVDLLDKQIKRLSNDIISKIEEQEGISLNKSLNPILKISASSISLKEESTKSDTKKTTFTSSGLKRLKKRNAGHISRDNEVYCYCRQVSYGEMIGCDNDDCPNEWFHLDCVGLSEPPRGVWFCPDCINAKRADRF